MPRCWPDQGESVGSCDVDICVPITNGTYTCPPACALPDLYAINRRLTLRGIQRVCSWKAIELGKEHRDSDRVVDMMPKDGAVTGAIGTFCGTPP